MKTSIINSQPFKYLSLLKWIFVFAIIQLLYRPINAGNLILNFKLLLLLVILKQQFVWH